MKQKDILFFFISTFVLVAAWVGFNIYHTYVTSTVAADVQNQLIPINGSFDTQTIEKLRTRTDVQPAYDFAGQTTSDASGAAQPTNIPSQDNATQTINQQGQL